MEQADIDYLQAEIEDKIASIASSADEFPGVTIIHSIADFKVKYMSALGLQQLGLSLQEVQALSTEEYHQRYFNPHDAEDYIPKIQDLLAKNSNDSISFFQQVRTSKDGNWVWHMSTMKILLRDDNGLPILFITLSFPVEPLQHITAKVSRLLDENNFLRKHNARYATLGKREREVLKQMALGSSSLEIAEKLNISTATAETHRRNIRQKLDANTSYEIAEYARAFDLI